MSIRFVLASCALLGCASEELALDETTQAVVQANGVSLNGVSLNGVSLNGVSLNGVSLNGVSLNGVSLNGSSLTGVRSDTGELLTIDAVGTTMTGTLSNGASIALRIDAATALDGNNSDVWTYGVSYASDLGWLPLCGDPSIAALAVAGTWNTEAGVPGGGAYTSTQTAFTLACRGKSIAKCVELGYKPWRGHTPYLESCVRLLRGDYCGDGTAYTQDGNRVNLFDAVGVQRDTETWLAEGEWTPDGARCISLDRETRFFASGATPSCIADGTLSTTLGCGQTFRWGAFLISELPVEQAVVPTKIK